ncbi:MAG TPA: hypothetical protein VN256_13070 [Pyrinomonadaceae bacterium]|nr:hypothetical protein [Pyrinomonadaceae bacterium]
MQDPTGLILLDPTLTPYIIAASMAVIGLLTWLVKQVIQFGKDIVKLETAFKYYLENTGKGAAMVLDSPNPTPDNIRVLLRKHQEGALSEEERQQLMNYLKRLKDDYTCPKSERNAAIQLLAAMQTMRKFKWA